MYSARDLSRTLGVGDEGKGGTSIMVLDLLWGWHEKEAIAKPRHIMELPEEEGRMQRWGGMAKVGWGGVARSQIALCHFFLTLL